jgi:SAM-dependent methyltransferase
VSAGAGAARAVAPGRIVFGEYENSGPRHDYREGQVVRFFTRHVARGAPVLDAGCGNGSLALQLARIGYRVTGVDLSDLQLERARAKGELAPAGRIEVAQGSLTALPFPSGAFAGAVSGEVLEHIPEDHAAMREIARVLAPGGVLVATVPFNPDLWDESDDYHHHVRRYSKESFGAMVRQAGLELERTFVWGFPFLGLYHRRVFIPWLRANRDRPAATVERSLAKRLAGTWLVRTLVAGVFHVDDLFSPLERGIGLLAVVRKPR